MTKEIQSQGAIKNVQMNTIGLLLATGVGFFLLPVLPLIALIYVVYRVGRVNENLKPE